MRRPVPLALLASTLLAGPTLAAGPAGDDFRHGLGAWRIEAEAPATVSAKGGVLDIDSPKGITLWYRPALTGPVTIDYDVMAVGGDGPNDKVSDVNAFWMARDADAADPLALPRARNGAFAAYDDLQTYYVGIGGNRNSTTRLRRYVGRPGDRPLLTGNDRSDKAAMLRANRWTHIRLIAHGRHIAVERDGARLFALDDAAPYTSGHFALRTTYSHLRVRNLRIGTSSGG
jgi:hypothetical protein